MIYLAWKPLVTLGIFGVLFTIANAQTPDWGPWRAIGSPCGGVQLYLAVTKDDGRNDFELKLKAENSNSYQVRTRLDILVDSDDGGHRAYSGIGSPIGAGRSVGEACAVAGNFCVGIPFPSGVNSLAPHQLGRITIKSVQVANMSSPLGSKPASAYHDPFIDFESQTCANLSLELAGTAKTKSVGGKVTWSFHKASRLPNPYVGETKHTITEDTIIENNKIRQVFESREEADGSSDYEIATVGNTTSLDQLDPESLRVVEETRRGEECWLLIADTIGKAETVMRSGKINRGGQIRQEEEYGRSNIAIRFETEAEARHASQILRDLISAAR